MNNLSIKAVFKESYSTFFGSLVPLLPMLIQFFLLAGVLTLGFYSYFGNDLFAMLSNPHLKPHEIQPSYFSIYGLQLLLYIAPMPLLAAIVRYTVLGEKYGSDYFSRLIAHRELKMVYYPLLVLIPILAVLVGVLIGLPLLLFMMLDPASLVGKILGGGVLVVGLILMFYLFVRLYPLMALIALDAEKPLKKSWDLTKGRVLKIFFSTLLVILPFMLVVFLMSVIVGIGAALSTESTTLGLFGFFGLYTLTQLFTYLLSMTTLGIITRELLGLKKK